MRVCMFVYNPLTNDARVFREAAALAAEGHTVDVIGRRDRGLAETEERDGFTIRRVLPEPLHKKLLRGAAEAYRKVRPRKEAGGDASPGDHAPAEGDKPQTPQRRHTLLYRELMLRNWLRRAGRLAAGLPAADVYHAHDLNALPAATKAARRAGAKLVYDSHEIYLERWLVTPAERRIWERTERRLIKEADRVITVCDPIADELARRYGVERPMVLMNCPELRGRDVPPDATTRLRERAGLNGGEDPIVLYQGMLQPERGLDELVDAAGRLERGAVVIMGKGVWSSRLQEEIESRGLGGRARLTGAVPADELPAYTAGAAVGVAPFDGKSLNSRWVAPNKLFEYMAAGVPVVASRLPVMEKVVDESGAGLLFEPGDSAGLADALNRLLSDEDLYRRLQANAVEASKAYNWENESRKLIGLYEELAR
jgi:glycosyltransferase involved in cell wall biosynthesis